MCFNSASVVESNAIRNEWLTNGFFFLAFLFSPVSFRNCSRIDSLASLDRNETTREQVGRIFQIRNKFPRIGRKKETRG